MLSFGRGQDGLPGWTAGEATDTDGSGPAGEGLQLRELRAQIGGSRRVELAGGRLAIRDFSRAIVAVSAPLKSSERWFTNSWANALAMSAERLGLPAVASIAMMLLWLSG